MSLRRSGWHRGPDGARVNQNRALERQTTAFHTMASPIPPTRFEFRAIRQSTGRDRIRARAGDERSSDQEQSASSSMTSHSSRSAKLNCGPFDRARSVIDFRDAILGKPITTVPQPVTTPRYLRCEAEPGRYFGRASERLVARRRRSHQANRPVSSRANNADCTA